MSRSGAANLPNEPQGGLSNELASSHLVQTPKNRCSYIVHRFELSFLGGAIKIRARGKMSSRLGQNQTLMRIHPRSPSAE
jgi:hypothetical protein